LTGRIWIASGDLIDAETDGMRGENAFRRILEWKSGTFENLPAEPGHERTITKPANALLLEAAQAMDEVAAPMAQSAEDAEQADNKKTVWRLASLTRAGAHFVVSVTDGPEGKAEGWGTEATQEFGQWVRLAQETCQKMARDLQVGDLVHLEGRSLDHRIVLLPQDGKAYLVGWPPDGKVQQLSESSKQLVATWDS
jgi:hypothetical protein